MNGSDLILNGEIVLDGMIMPHDWCEFMEGGCFSARMLREALAQFPGDVTVRINSSGGDPFEGEAMRAALAAHPGEVRVEVTGLAASAASLLIMGAGRIEMTAGSLLMIHDPSSCLCGTAGDHRAEAEVLETMSATYAGVYAARSGQPREAVLAMMAATTWMGGEEAVEAGFADALAGQAATDTSPPARAAAMAAHRDTLSALRRCAAQFNAASRSGPVSRTATVGHSQAAMAATEEADMPQDDENPVVTTPPVADQEAPQTPSVTMQAPDAEAITVRATEAERARQRDIRSMSAAFVTAGQLSQAQVDKVIDEGVTAAEAGNRLMSMMAPTPQAGDEASDGQRVHVRRDAGETRMEGMICALMRDYEGPGAAFRGMRLRRMALELAGPGRGYNETDAIQRGMMSTRMMGGAHGVSDFAYITTEVMNRSLMREYDRRGANWNIVTGAPMQASDFRELHAVRFGGDFQLKPVKENGEYESAVLADEAEGLTVERRGRDITLTFEAVINDDMGAFTGIPREFAIASRVMEASMVWGLIRSNATLKSDGTALFHADHGNLAGSGGAISVTTVGAARKAMWEQKAYGAAAGSDDFLQIVPDRLLVAPAKEVAAQQFVADITPAKIADSNPFRNSITPYTVPHLGAAAGGSDTAWYLVSSDLPPVSVAYLEGYEAPTVRTIEGMNPDVVKMNARHIFGAAASEFRGAYKNAGA
ncbi:head maturation protease, ClpP-related [Marinovum sp.]|uniref:head maturation protease, ClpP-related n=1 Tax=Marinovum sp. TaxID=2024839 RepID=UPI002B265A44|nr:head maturation protease, ClpP-related [Marinovum sp.]